MKVLFSTSPIGLGHATRDIVIADALRERIDAEVVFVSGHPASRLLRDYGYRVYEAYEPPSFKVVDGELKNLLSWSLRYLFYHRRCKSIIKHIIKEEEPDLAIGDEDLAIVGVASRLGIPTILIVDFLEFEYKGSFLLRGFGRYLNSLYRRSIESAELVLVPDEGVDHNTIKFVGRIVRPISESRESLRKAFGIEGKAILVTVGGTDCGLFLIRSSLEAAKRLNRPGLHWLINLGPSVAFSKLDPEMLRPPNVRFFGYRRDLHELVYASDLVITLAGKSTADEAITYGTPLIAIPIKGHFEQEAKARRLGFVHEDLRRLDELILKKLEEARGQPQRADASLAVDAIIEFVKKRYRSWAIVPRDV